MKSEYNNVDNNNIIYPILMRCENIDKEKNLIL